jgi:hypothetical protein
MSMWGITTFFNPSGYRTKLDNYRKFRAGSRKQGLPLLAVELAFGDSPFVLEEGADAEIVVQKRSTSVLWQKERLLNVAVARLPADCRHVCWADADVLFERDDWIEASVAVLKDSAVMQPFQYAIRLPRGATPKDYPSSRIGFWIRRGTGVKTYSVSWCSDLTARRPTHKGTTGYAWCAHKSLLDKHKFYDRCILGGGDREFARAVSFGSEIIADKHFRNHQQRIRQDVGRWREAIAREPRFRLGYLPGALHHLWHGDPAQRNYIDRHSILEEHDFDPTTDIALDDAECWKWSTDKKRLMEAVEAYFESRKEDG